MQSKPTRAANRGGLYRQQLRKLPRCQRGCEVDRTCHAAASVATRCSHRLAALALALALALTVLLLLQVRAQLRRAELRAGQRPAKLRRDAESGWLQLFHRPLATVNPHTAAADARSVHRSRHCAQRLHRRLRGAAVDGHAARRLQLLSDNGGGRLFCKLLAALLRRLRRRRHDDDRAGVASGGGAAAGHGDMRDRQRLLVAGGPTHAPQPRSVRILQQRDALTGAQVWMHERRNRVPRW
jgi:hypothetical protein